MEHAVRAAEKIPHLLEVPLDGRVSKSLLGVDLPKLAGENPLALEIAVPRAGDEAAHKTFGQIKDVLAPADGVEKVRHLAQRLGQAAHPQASILVRASLAECLQGLQCFDDRRRLLLATAESSRGGRRLRDVESEGKRIFREILAREQAERVDGSDHLNTI